MSGTVTFIENVRDSECLIAVKLYVLTMTWKVYVVASISVINGGILVLRVYSFNLFGRGSFVDVLVLGR